MTTTLWIEPFGGLAGDMFLAALCDLAHPRFGIEDLERLAEALVPGEAVLTLAEVRRGGFRARALEVRTPESADPPHRHLADLYELVDRLPDLAPRTRERARRVFRCIAEAEARVHGSSVDAIHFHEVGAVDSVIDVLGAALALERLGVERVVASEPLVGSGYVHCAHGELPVPAPGTAEILRGLPQRTGGDGERLTPTGAALLAVLVDAWGTPGAFRAAAIGYGAGQRETLEGPANLVRVQLGEALEDSGAARAPGRVPAWLGAFQLDDATGQAIGFAIERLRAAGALDVWTSACQMKKDRPGVVVSFLCRAAEREELERVAFDATPTFGVRWNRVERTECAREQLVVRLEGRDLRVKVRHRPHRDPAQPPERSDFAPEYDDVAAWARASGRELGELRERVVRAALAAAQSSTPEPEPEPESDSAPR